MYDVGLVSDWSQLSVEEGRRGEYLNIVRRNSSFSHPLCRGMRSGTLPAPLLVGLGAACELAGREMEVGTILREYSCSADSATPRTV